MSPSRAPQVVAAARARRNLVLGGIALAVAVVVSVVVVTAVPLGLRGQGVAQIQAAPEPRATVDAGVRAVADLRTAPIASLGADATATLELVGDSAGRARLALPRDEGWVDAGDRIALSRSDAADGVVFRVSARDSRQDGHREPVIVRLTVSQGLLPDIADLEVDLTPS